MEFKYLLFFGLVFISTFLVGGLYYQIVNNRESRKRREENLKKWWDVTEKFDKERYEKREEEEKTFAIHNEKRFKEYIKSYPNIKNGYHFWVTQKQYEEMSKDMTEEEKMITPKSVLFS